MIRTYAHRTIKKRAITAVVLFCLMCAVALWKIFTTHDGHELLWYVGGVAVVFILLMRYMASYQSLKGKYVFSKDSGCGEYFSDNLYTRKKYLRGMDVVPICMEPVIVKHSATFAQDGKVMRLAISLSFAPDIHNLSLYVARQWNGLGYVGAASALLREVLADLAKEGTCYCEGCAEDRLRDGLMALGLVLTDVSRTLKSDTVLFD